MPVANNVGYGRTLPGGRGTDAGVCTSRCEMMPGMAWMGARMPVANNVGYGLTRLAVAVLMPG